MSLEHALLEHAVRKLRQMDGRIAECLDRLTAGQIWARDGENENAVGNLVLHLCGNVRQWILHGLGGQPDVRVRDGEFSARGELSASDLKQRLARTVAEAAAVLEKLPPAQLGETVTIQKYTLTKLEAVCHVVEHFAEHTGQIIFAAKRMTGADLGFYSHLNKAAHGQKTP